MKQIIAIMILVLVMMSFTACCTPECNERLATLQEENASLKAQIDELNQTTIVLEKEDSISEEFVTEEPVTEEFIAEESVTEEFIAEESVTEESVPELSQIWESYLNKKIESAKKYEDWLEVANCEFATENHLMKVVQECLDIDPGTDGDIIDQQFELSNLIINHPSVTEKIILLMVKSDSLIVWRKAAEYEKAGYATMASLVEKCLEIESWDANSQYFIANTVSENSETTEELLFKLIEASCPDVWKEIIKSEKATAELLLEVAKRTITVDYFYREMDNFSAQLEICNELAHHALSTDEVMLELSKIQNLQVCSILVMSPRSGEKTLLAVAEQVIAEDKEIQLSMSKVIANHPKTTTSVMLKLTESSFYEVVYFVQQWFEKK